MENNTACTQIHFLKNCVTCSSIWMPVLDNEKWNGENNCVACSYVWMPMLNSEKWNGERNWRQVDLVFEKNVENIIDGEGDKHWESWHKIIHLCCPHIFLFLPLILLPSICPLISLFTYSAEMHHKFHLSHPYGFHACSLIPIAECLSWEGNK